MALQVCIEDTTELCEATQADALTTASSHETNVDGISGTTRWSEVRERLDGKFDTIVYEYHNYGSKTLQNYDVADYASVD